MRSENAKGSVPEPPLPHYRLKFEAGEEVRLPSYSGSAWRGAVGHALVTLNGINDIVTPAVSCAEGLPQLA